MEHPCIEAVYPRMPDAEHKQGKVTRYISYLCTFRGNLAGQFWKPNADWNGPFRIDPVRQFSDSQLYNVTNKTKQKGGFFKKKNTSIVLHPFLFLLASKLEHDDKGEENLLKVGGC